MFVPVTKTQNMHIITDQLQPKYKSILKLHPQL